MPARVIDGSPLFEPDLVGVPVPAGGAIGAGRPRPGARTRRPLPRARGQPAHAHRAGTTRAWRARWATPASACPRTAADRCSTRPTRRSADALRARRRTVAATRRSCSSPTAPRTRPGSSRRRSRGAWPSRSWPSRTCRAAAPTGLRARVDGRARPVEVLYRRTDEDRLRDARGRPDRAGPPRARTAAPRHARLRERLRRRRGRRQARPRLRGGDGPLLSRGGADAALGRRVGPRRAATRARRCSTGSASSWSSPGSRRGAPACSSGRTRAPSSSRTPRGAIRTDPARWIAQETIVLSHHPTLTPGGLRPRHVDLRPLVTGGTVVDGRSPGRRWTAGWWSICPGRGAAKDTWLVR